MSVNGQAPNSGSGPSGPKRGPALALLYGGAGLACIASVPLAACFGSLSIPFSDVLRALWAWLFGTLPASGAVALNPEGMQQYLDPETLILVVADLRLPRVLLALFSGMGLAVAGAVFQGILRNPLADPFTLGVSGGAAFGAALTISLGAGAAFGGMGIPLAAFAGAGLALGAVLFLATAGGERGILDRERLILGGVVVSAFLAALIALLKALDESSVSGIVFWIMGSFQGRGWADLGLALPGLVLGGAMALSRPRELDLLSLGDSAARHLGLNAGKSRLLLLAAAGAATASCVAVTGIIGFVGLIVPHLCRLLLGAGHALVLPAAALGGGLLLLWSDVAARSLLSGGAELPVGVVTALLGGPFFCYLLMQNGKQPLRGGQPLVAPFAAASGPAGSKPSGASAASASTASPAQPGSEPSGASAASASIPSPARAEEHCLEVRNLFFRYKGREEHALNGVSFCLKSGQSTALLGPNGCGKSTLLHCIAGILKPEQGEVLFNDRGLGGLGERQRARLMAVLPQRAESVPALSAWHMALMGRYARTGPWSGYSREDRVATARAMRLAGAEHLAAYSVAGLSGGELQRVLLARVLAQETPLLLLDEPTSGLDPAMQTAAMDILSCAAPGRTSLAAMHDLNLAALYCDRILLMKRGRIVADGSAEEVFTPKLLEEVYETPFLPVRHAASGRPQVLPLTGGAAFPSGASREAGLAAGIDAQFAARKGDLV